MRKTSKKLDGVLGQVRAGREKDRKTNRGRKFERKTDSQREKEEKDRQTVCTRTRNLHVNGLAA